MSTANEHLAGDALIAGAGLAGLFTALKLADRGRQVTVLSGVARPGGATSTWAQGGIAAALGPDDTADLHVADTLAAGDGLVDEAALAEALTDGRLLGAGIDVFETEPIRPDNPLLTAPNTVLTDHMAWYSERSVRALQEKAAAEVDRVLAGGTPKSWLNRWSDQPA